MSSQAKTLLRPEAYLLLERRAEYKSEYLDGETMPMTGASRKHNLIVTNLVRELSQQLKGKPCEVYSNDMRVRVPATNLYAYPDVAAVCGEPQFEDEAVDTLLNPTVIVEVLSESTEAYDRGKKFGYYRTVGSLAEYLLVAQDEFSVEHYVKREDGRWLLADLRSPDAALELVALGCVLRLSEIYDKVAL